MSRLLLISLSAFLLYLAHFTNILLYWNRVGSSFLNGPQGMFCGARHGHSKPRDLPYWDVITKREWKEDDEGPRLNQPHILLVTCTGAKVSADGNGLLHGELGPIAEAIYCRLLQEELKDTSVFPVWTAVFQCYKSQSSPAYTSLLIGSGSLAVRPMAGTYPTN